MDEKQFKKHLADLAHGHHHPEEHDWGDSTVKISNKPSDVAPGEAGSIVEPAKSEQPKPARKRAKVKRPATARRKNRK
jgi:hypothetical protein